MFPVIAIQEPNISVTSAWKTGKLAFLNSVLRNFFQKNCSFEIVTALDVAISILAAYFPSARHISTASSVLGPYTSDTTMTYVLQLRILCHAIP
ncbi:hypothetical protein AVEN_272919-1 [Araneus ventricosus]|uniref:Uncharacterized protein n=1 Tax=Araneus ventricosus TaxID=182803 RepID=A0A4Y2IR64_ARAVE|nr:hypothetical protein AVEN_32981-1 [Araneus ventricosus]GBO29139.1 hypothetical protein AVEN_272919-1 [Araneus ventricosus]